jgi:hypothetical protein
MQSDDPDFERKAADVIGLYVTPPDHAAIVAVEKIQPSRRWSASTRSCPLVVVMSVPHSPDRVMAV